MVVLDRVDGVVYVAISERADRSLAEEWTHQMGYKELVAFRWVARRSGHERMSCFPSEREFQDEARQEPSALSLLDVDKRAVDLR